VEEAGEGELLDRWASEERRGRRTFVAI